MSAPLSTLNLLQSIQNLFEDQQELESFISGVMKCGFTPGDDLKDWQGIDSKVCIVLLHLAIENSKGSFYIVPGFPKKFSVAVYGVIYSIYETICKQIKLKFIPNLKGLATITQRYKARIAG